MPVASQVWLAGAPEPPLASNDRVRVVELSLHTAKIVLLLESVMLLPG